MESIASKLARIKNAFHDLQLEKVKLSAENSELKLKLDHLKNELEFEKNIKNREKIIKIAELFHQTEKKDLSKQLGKMIKNIDQCIALIEHEEVETNPR